MVSQWSVCARQKKGKAWMGSNFFQKIETVVENTVLPSPRQAQQVLGDDANCGTGICLWKVIKNNLLVME